MGVGVAVSDDIALVVVTSFQDFLEQIYMRASSAFLSLYTYVAPVLQGSLGKVSPDVNTTSFFKFTLSVSTVLVFTDSTAISPTVSFPSIFISPLVSITIFLAMISSGPAAFS